MLAPDDLIAWFRSLPPDGFPAAVRALPPDVFLGVAPALCDGDPGLCGRLFRLHAGLADPNRPCDPTDPAATGRVLRARLAGADPDLAAQYLVLLASTLHLCPTPAGVLAADPSETAQRDGVSAALTALEGYAGVRTSDYPLGDASPGDCLGGRLRACLAGTSPDPALGFLTLLAGCCSHSPHRGTRAALAVMESFFGLGAGGYTPGALDARVGPWAEPMGVGFCQLLTAWGPYLQGLGRAGEARDLFRWVFGWTDGELTDGSTLAGRVRRRLAGLPPDLATPTWATVPAVLHPFVSSAEVLRFVESWLALRPGEAGDPAALGRRLRWCEAEGREYLPDAFLARAMSLLQGLAHARAPDRSLNVFRALAGRAGGNLPAGLAEVAAALPAHHRAEFHKRVATTFFQLEQLSEAVRYLEGLFGIAPADYADPETLAAKVRDTTAGFAPDEPVALAALLAASLSDAPGRRGDGQAVAGACLWRVLDLDGVPTVNSGAVFPVCGMLELWLDAADPRTAYERCGQVVSFLRRCLDVRGAHLEDRERFVREVAALRRRVVQAGYQHVGSDPSEAARVLGWDAELGQRVLFERYRFHRPSPPAGPDPDASAVTPGWSLADDPPDVDDYLPRGGPAGRFGLGAAGPVPTRPPTPDLADAPDDRCRAAERILREGTSGEQLAAALGADALLLRAGFLTDGRLFWRAFRSDGRGLTCVAGDTPPDTAAAADLAAAAAWHDRVLDAVWAEQGQAGRPLADLCRELVGYADDLRARLTGRRRARFDPAAAGRTADALLARCEEEPAAGAGFRDWFRSALPADWTAVKDGRPWADAWTGIAGALRDLADGAHDRRLDASTAEFLRRVARRWDLSDLAGHLSPGLDLVVEVEDALHAVPVAFLPVPGPRGPVRLFEQVRSVRSSLSLLLRLLEPAGGRDPARGGGLITVSWFRAGDPARAGARWLHHGQRLLARRYGRPWASAGDRPAGEAGAIARGVADGPGVRVLAVCGHGQVAGPGVCLGDGQSWAGEGCDLERVDWLLSVSCSIGRLVQRPAVPDVDGFIAALIARRARAALACRWPVHALQAAGFANAVADEYLAPDRQTGRHDRAAALARARWRFFGPAVPQAGAVGVNTAAAFDLFGEG